MESINGPEELRGMKRGRGDSQGLRRVLVIGGTQFMGRHMVEQLLAAGGFEIVMLNRGKTAIPPSFVPAIEAGAIRHLRCDRLNHRARFRELVAEAGPFEVIIDFVAFGPNQIDDGAVY